MNIPNLPTDNLYKFMALSGTLMLIIFLIYPLIITNKINDEITAIETELGELEFNKNTLNEKVTVLMEAVVKIDSLVARYDLKDLPTNNIQVKELFERLYDPEYREYLQFYFNNKQNIIPEAQLLDEAIFQRQQIKLIKNELLLNLHKIARKIELLKQKNRESKIINIICTLGLLSGFGLMSCGFYLWYFRVQKYLDEKLKKEVTG